MKVVELLVEEETTLSAGREIERWGMFRCAYKLTTRLNRQIETLAKTENWREIPRSVTRSLVIYSENWANSFLPSASNDN